MMEMLLENESAMMWIIGRMLDAVINININVLKNTKIFLETDVVFMGCAVKVSRLFFAINTPVK